MSDVYEVTTNVALQILMKGVEKTVKKEKLTKPELLVIGRALGWLALVTAGTNVDLFKDLARASDELKETTKNQPESMVPFGKESEAITAGRRRRRSTKGGASVAALIIAAIAILYAGNTAMTLGQLEQNRRTLRSEAIKTIQSACPIDLLAGSPEKPLIDWTGDYARALSQFSTQESICSSTKTVMTSRIRQAEDSLFQAWARLPNDAAAFATVSTMVMTAPAGPATALTTAASVGAAVKQITESVISGQLPSRPEELNKFVKAVSEAFPEKPPADEGTAQPMFTGVNTNPDVIVPDPGREGPVGRRRGGRRQTKKKATKKRRVTRRRPTFSY